MTRPLNSRQTSAFEESVFFPGEVPGEEIPIHHALSTFFVMVSRSVERFESFGIESILKPPCAEEPRLQGIMAVCLRPLLTV